MSEKIEFSFSATAKIELEHERGEKQSILREVKLFLEPSDNMKHQGFNGEDQLPTAKGSAIVTKCFVQGLIGNIHHAHAKGFKNDAQHLREIIQQLEDGFMSVVKVRNGYIDDKPGS